MQKGEMLVSSWGNNYSLPFLTCYSYRSTWSMILLHQIPSTMQYIDQKHQPPKMMLIEFPVLQLINCHMIFQQWSFSRFILP